MHLKKVTVILVVSMIASFSFRRFGILLPSIFYNILIVKTAILINVFSILSYFLFMLVFYQENISVKKIALKRPCTLAIVGLIGISKLYLKKFPFVLDPQCPLLLFSQI